MFEADEISVTYGGLRAVDRLTLEVRAGEIVGLIGPNGAGKTSFIDGVTGFTPSDGQVRLLGVPLADATAGARARQGLVRTWQSVELFDDLSVQDNVRVSDDVGHDAWKMLRDSVRPSAPASAAVADAIALVGLEHAVTASRSSSRSAIRSSSASPARWRCGPRSCCSTSPPPASTWPRSPPSDGACRRSPPPASGACSSTMTCASCSACATALRDRFRRPHRQRTDRRGAPRPGRDRRLPRLGAPQHRRVVDVLTTVPRVIGGAESLMYVSGEAEPGGPVSQYILFFVLGLSVGAVYAALAMGIVVTYQGTGVINFAAAAMATVPLYVYSDLKQGQLHLPIPWLPAFDITPPPTWVSIVIALVVAAVLGAIVQLVVSRPLRTAPVLAKVVAAVGIMLTLQAALSLKYGTDARPTTASCRPEPSSSAAPPCPSTGCGSSGWWSCSAPRSRSGSGARAPASPSRRRPRTSGRRRSPDSPPATRHGDVGAGDGVRHVHHDHGRPGDRRADAGEPDPARRPRPRRRPDRPAQLGVDGADRCARARRRAVGAAVPVEHQVVVAGVGQAGSARRRAVHRDRHHVVRCSVARSRCAARTSARASRRSSSRGTARSPSPSSS